jgi:hypothetical protein
MTSANQETDFIACRYISDLIREVAERGSIQFFDSQMLFVDLCMI